MDTLIALDDVFDLDAIVRKLEAIEPEPNSDADDEGTFYAWPPQTTE